MWKFLKQVNLVFDVLVCRITNSVKAFRPVEWGYHVAIARFNQFEVAYREGTSDEAVFGHSFDNDFFFTNAPEYTPKPDDIIIDVGAQHGTFSLLAASKVPRGKVFAVEPCLESFNLLRINIALNGFRNIEASHLALSGKKGETRLNHYNFGHWGDSTTWRWTSEGEMVSADTLGGYMDDKRIDRCAFIKFNCEGAEFPILLNSPPDVLKRIDRMLLNYHCFLNKGVTADSLVQHLSACGFKLRFFEQKRRRGGIYAERIPV